MEAKTINQVNKEKEILEIQIERLIDEFLKENDNLKGLYLSTECLGNGVGQLCKVIINIELKI